MISKSHFAKTQLLHAKPGIFIQNSYHSFDARLLEIKDNGEFEVTHFAPHIPEEFIDSCCGIMLLFESSSGALLVANPVTMKAVKLAPLHSRWLIEFCAIVRLPRTGEFKLFAFDLLDHSDGGYRDFYVLRLGKDDSWKRSTHEFDVKFIWRPIYMGGNDLYLITEQKVILMDVDAETFRQFPNIPQGNDILYRQYLKMGNCLAFVVNLGAQGCQIHTFDTELGRWTLYHQVRSFDYPIDGFNVVSQCFMMWINQEMIIQTILSHPLTTSLKYKLFTYNVKTRTIRKIDAVEEDSSYINVRSHTNSLLWCKSALP